jgi:hypothetical protein
MTTQQHRGASTVWRSASKVGSIGLGCAGCFFEVVALDGWVMSGKAEEPRWVSALAAGGTRRGS